MYKYLASYETRKQLDNLKSYLVITKYGKENNRSLKGLIKAEKIV